MNTLPPEILEKILSTLSRQDLLAVTLTSTVLHYPSITILYRTIQEIQLFSWENAHLPSIMCLQTLATPGNNPRAVRHFAVRGVPWLQADTMRTLSQGLVNMSGLLSLDLDMGAVPEVEVFLESRCASSSFLPRLNAISLHDHSKAVALIAGRPVEYLRIRAIIGGAVLPELLTKSKLGSSPLRCLQIWISVSNLTSAVDLVANIACGIPSLKTLGITFTFPTPRWTGTLYGAVEQIVNSLTGLRELEEFGLALIPEPREVPTLLTNPSICIDLVHHRLPQLRLIEVQWEARKLRDGVLQSLGNHHLLMRRTWRYPYSSRDS